jgi:hypothetical protein
MYLWTSETSLGSRENLATLNQNDDSKRL